MIPGSLALLLRYCRRSKSFGLLCTHKSGVMATESNVSDLSALPESDDIEKLEEKNNSEVAEEPRMPQQGDLNGEDIKAEGSDKDAGFEFVEYRMVIKQEKNEENAFSNATYSSSENMSEIEGDSKDVIHINSETFKEEVSDSTTRADFETEAVNLKAETATSSQDMKVEIETVPIIDSELESTKASESTAEAAVKPHPENADAGPKSNHSEEAVQRSNPFTAEFNKWVRTKLQKETVKAGGTKKYKSDVSLAVDEDIRQRRKQKWSKRVNQKKHRKMSQEAGSQCAKSNHGEEAVKPSNPYNAEFYKWFQTEWQANPDK